MNATVVVPNSARSEKPAFLAQEILFWGLIGVLCFGTLAFGAATPWGRFVLEAGAALLLVGWGLLGAKAGDFELQWNTVFNPLLCFGLLALAQLLFGLTAYRYATRINLLMLAAYFSMAFLAGQLLVHRKMAIRFVYFCASFGGLYAVFAILQYFTSPGKLYWVQTPKFASYLFGSYVNHNHYAGMIELLVGFPLVLSLSARTAGPIRTLSAFATTLMVVSVFLCGSRGGMIAVTVQMVVAFVLLPRVGNLRRRLVAILVGLTLVVGAVWWLGDAQVFERLSMMANTLDGNAPDLRQLILKDSLRMWQERPVLGWGLGTFDSTFPSHQSFFFDKAVVYAHDDYLQVLVEEGIVGFGVMLWFVFTVCRRAFRISPDWRESTRRMLPVAALLGCIGLLVHSFTDFNLEMPANGMWFFVLATATCLPALPALIELHVPRRQGLRREFRR